MAKKPLPGDQFQTRAFLQRERDPVFLLNRKGRPLPEGLLNLRHRLPERYRFDSLVSDVPECERMLEQVRLAAEHRMPVMLVGDPGTGKRWIARVIHHHGVTAEQSFLAIDCNGLPSVAVGNLLFGDAGLGRPERTGTVYLREP